jgi:hypothetical protein
LLQQLNAQVKSGDTAGAASTILQLKADSQNNPNMSASMKALLQSISSGKNGLTIDPQLLSALLGANSPTANGVPSGLRNESPSRIPVDLNTIANLLQYVDPTLASTLLGEAGQPTLGGQGPKSIPITPPGINLNKLGFPAISTPTFGSVGGGVGLPTVNPADFAFPLLVVAAIIGVFLSRHRFGRLLGSQRFPAMGEVGELEPELEVAPNTPKERVIAIFRKSVRLMRGRGVPKFRHETHREFSSKCSERPEGEHIGTISSLYEKAVFSGTDVTPSDATLAEREGESVEKTP